MASSKKLQSPEQCASLLSDVDTILFDCDGVLWVGNNDPIPESAKTIDYIRNLGKRLRFVTNNSSKSREEYLKKFTSLGFRVNKEEIFTSGYVAAYYLKNHLNYKGKIYLIGMTGTQSEFEMLGMECLGVGPAPLTGSMDNWLKESLDPEVGCVVVGYDSHFSYMKMFRAVSYVNRPGCIFIATNEDSRLPTKGGEIVIPGTGCFVAAMRHGAERDPIVVGKPEKPIFDCISHSLDGLDPSRTLMIGDRLDTDMLFGRKNGMKTLLVLSGVSSEKDVLNAPEYIRPDYYVPAISTLLPPSN